MNLANGMTKIIPPEIESTYGDLSKGPVIGSGPWIFRGDMDGDGYMFEANPNYYEESMPRLDRLNILVIADEISPDTCRLWDATSEKKLDKDRFRKDLGNIIQAYQAVARRLGIMHEDSNISEVKFGKPQAVNLKKK